MMQSVENENEVRQMVAQNKTDNDTVNILTVENGSTLVKLLNYLKDRNICIVKIQRECPPQATAIITKPGEQKPSDNTRYEIHASLRAEGQRLNELLAQIENRIGAVRCRRCNETTAGNKEPCPDDVIVVSPGFPMRIRELDATSKHVIMYGDGLDADHPGFKDPEYRKRRLEFARIALNYQHGQPLPRLEYNEVEKRTWATVFTELMRLYPTYACREILANVEILRQECGYSEKEIPQLPDVANFLKSRSGFQLRPMAGYLSPRDFLAGLAFRVFPVTLYVRHPADPFYSPEPDCCHELIGHIPMLADPEYAQFSQEIGLASLGASEEVIKKLAILYFFTMEFGLCYEKPEPCQQGTKCCGGQPNMRVYGAGLLSCVSELKHVLSGKADIRKFNPSDVTKAEPMITTFQKQYFCNNSFPEAVEEIRRYADSIKKPFTVRYNPYTEALEIIDNATSAGRLINELRQDAGNLSSTLRRLGYDGNLHYLKSDNTVEEMP